MAGPLNIVKGPTKSISNWPLWPPVKKKFNQGLSIASYITSYISIAIHTCPGKHLLWYLSIGQLVLLQCSQSTLAISVANDV